MLTFSTRYISLLATSLRLMNHVHDFSRQASYHPHVGDSNDSNDKQHERSGKDTLCILRFCPLAVRMEHLSRLYNLPMSVNLFCDDTRWYHLVPGYSRLAHVPQTQLGALNGLAQGFYDAQPTAIEPDAAPPEHSRAHRISKISGKNFLALEPDMYHLT